MDFFKLPYLKNKMILFKNPTHLSSEFEHPKYYHLRAFKYFHLNCLTIKKRVFSLFQKVIVFCNNHPPPPQKKSIVIGSFLGYCKNISILKILEFLYLTSSIGKKVFTVDDVELDFRRGCIFMFFS